MCKIVPDDFNQPLFRASRPSPFGSWYKATMFKIDPVNFFGHRSLFFNVQRYIVFPVSLWRREIINHQPVVYLAVRHHYDVR